MQAPLIVGRYRIYEPIAAGGMATVHFARLVGEVGFARTVAVKRLHPKRWGNSEMVASLVDEARLASRIQHPHVVPTLDVFVANAELFVVMEYVTGESFARLLRGYIERAEPVPTPLALGVVVGVLQGLHAAHEAKSELGKPLNIVHRDVSPQNVIVGIDGLPRVLDFGIAKAADRLTSTTAGQIKGKIRYMAPEQSRGEKVSRATDVYAAGIVLWEALAGKRLYQSEADVARAVVYREEPPELSSVNPAIDPRLSDAVKRALAYDAVDRFQDAQSFANALEDAAEIAPARRLAEWVRTVAAEALAERETKLAAIERDSALRPIPRGGTDDETETDVTGGAPPASATTVPAAVALAGARAPDTTAVDSPVEGTGIALSTKVEAAMSVSGSSRASSTSQSRRRMRSVWIFGGAVVAGSALGVSVFYGSSKPSTAPAAARSAAAQTTTAAASPTVTPTEPSAAVIATQASSNPAASAAAASPDTSASTSSAATTVPRTGVRPAAPPSAPAPPPTTKPADICNPPFTVGADGVQRFKKECL